MFKVYTFTTQASVKLHGKFHLFVVTFGVDVPRAVKESCSCLFKIALRHNLLDNAVKASATSQHVNNRVFSPPIPLSFLHSPPLAATRDGSCVLPEPGRGNLQVSAIQSSHSFSSAAADIS
jgi:hypothetical protein